MSTGKSILYSAPLLSARGDHLTGQHIFWAAGHTALPRIQSNSLLSLHNVKSQKSAGQIAWTDVDRLSPV